MDSNTVSSAKNFENINGNGNTDKEGSNPEDAVAQHEPAQVAPQGTPAQVAFNALLDSVEAGAKEWPRLFLAAAHARHNARMPRGGWARGLVFYNAKFGAALSLEKFQEMARRKRLDATHGSSAARPDKRRRVNAPDVDVESLAETNAYLRIRASLSTKVSLLAGQEVRGAVRTRKIPSDRVDWRILDLVKRAVAEIVDSSAPRTMTAVAKILQAAQVCYEEALPLKARSPWRQSILARIQKEEAAVAALEAVQGRTPTDAQAKDAAGLLRKHGLAMNTTSVQALLVKARETVRIFQKKIETSDRRTAFRRENNLFELHRARFYRDLADEATPQHGVPVDMIREFWSRMWAEPEHRGDYDEYLLDHVADGALSLFPTEEEFVAIIMQLPSWKAAGPDGVYNFFIKQMRPLHKPLYNVVRSICLGGEDQEPWFYCGLTHLIPKGTPASGADFRPITCMSALYKLTTRAVAEVLRLEVERRGLLAENQLGAVRKVQGAKEQALLNIAVNRAHGNSLKATWIDVKKAFDTIPHDYIERCIGSLSLPSWILEFLKTAMRNWKLEIRAGRDQIMEKDVKRGIIQGDSLSPLLFVLCVDPLSRRLNEKHRKVCVDLEIDAESHATNHLLFIDDLKLLAPDTETLAALTRETERFFEAVGLEINRQKSATNDPAMEHTGTLLEGPMVYKYLGIVEDRCGRPTKESFAKVREELLSRVDRLCKRKLNAKNLFKAINEHAIALVNYHVGVQPLEPADFADLDTAVRQVLIRHRIHLLPASKERLYLPRNELGRGLHSIEMRSEQMLLQLWDALQKGTGTRRAAITRIEVQRSSHLSLIRAYLAIRYRKEALNQKTLKEAQKEHWYSENKKRILHSKLYRARNNEMVDLLGSSTWLRAGNVAPRDEGAFCLVQDRNLFWLTGGECGHCREGVKTVDHLASKCKMMARHDYTRRHNDVVRCLHLLLATKYGFKRSPRIRNHSVQEAMDNSRAEIRVDTRIKTDVRLAHNRPDIFVYDKAARLITLIEVGITSQQNLVTVETEKARKYDLLADELACLYKCRVRIIPFVMTWEGVVTNKHCRFARELGVSPHVAAYVQTRVLKRTLETISFEHRRSIEDTGREEAVEEAIRRIGAAAECVPARASAEPLQAQEPAPDK